MNAERKPVKCGCDWFRNRNWNIVRLTRKGLLRKGMQIMDPQEKRLGFKPCIFDAGEYYRLSFGSKF